MKREKEGGGGRGFVGRFVREISSTATRYTDKSSRLESRYLKKKISLSIFPEQVARKREISIDRSTNLRRVITVLFERHRGCGHRIAQNVSLHLAHTVKSEGRIIYMCYIIIIIFLVVGGGGVLFIRYR